MTFKLGIGLIGHKETMSAPFDERPKNASSAAAAFRTAASYHYSDLLILQLRYKKNDIRSSEMF
jgi:hypothetical protein